MSFRTFYTVVTTNKDYENVEHFNRQGDGFIRIKYYPVRDVITNEIININPEVKQIPVENVVEVQEREIRF